MIIWDSILITLFTEVATVLLQIFLLDSKDILDMSIQNHFRCPKLSNMYNTAEKKNYSEALVEILKPYQHGSESGTVNTTS